MLWKIQGLSPHAPENSLTPLKCKSNSAVAEKQHDRIFSRLVFNKTWGFSIINITRFSGLALGMDPRTKKKNKKEIKKKKKKKREWVAMM